MKTPKIQQFLHLISMLVRSNGVSVEMLAESANMHPRAVYRALESFRKAGLIVNKMGSLYSIDPNSPFLSDISGDIHFSKAEALTMAQVLRSVNDNSQQVRYLREKLSRLYGDDVLAHHAIDDQYARNFRKLFQAVSEERMCVLRGYTSNHSGQTRDRVVEPYIFLAENNEVRCFEPDSGMNKTFKISRAESIDLLDLRWSFKDRHEEFFTDLFHFSGKERVRVRLRMGSMAANLLCEEVPSAQEQIRKLPDGRYLLDTQVCSFVGIGRFVVGLLDDIEIVGSPRFAEYMKEYVAQMNVRVVRK